MIYLDNHATTPCDPDVVEAMLPYFGEVYANPGSSLHRAGSAAADAVRYARAKTADLIGAGLGELIFTSGATESNNISILGLANFAESKRTRIVTTAIEHKAVLAPIQSLQNRGFEVVQLPINRDGTVDLSAAEQIINTNTLLVSVQAANNEIGTIEPVKKLSDISHENGALFHCDAAQAVGKIPIDVQDLGVDLLSLSAHKLYGPKGIGALYVRGGPYALPISPISIGGGQEKGLRAGTLNVPGIVGFGKACEICSESMIEEAHRTGHLRDLIEDAILDAKLDSVRNGALDHRLPGNSSLTLRGLEAEALIANIPEIAISTGSACTVGTPEPSHVLLATGMSRDDAYSTVRIGVGRFNTEEEIATASAEIVRVVNRLEKLRI